MVILCSSNGAPRAEKLLHFLRRAAVDAVVFPVPDGSPSLANVNRTVQFVRRVGCSGVAGYGGGGILDMAKVGVCVCACV